MSAEIVSLVDWRETRNSKAALARWARRLRKQLEENMAAEQPETPAPATDDVSGMGSQHASLV